MISSKYVKRDRNPEEINTMSSVYVWQHGPLTKATEGFGAM
jgi:hypothetical protein